MKHRRLIAAGTFAALTIGGLSAGSIASAQSYGGDDTADQTSGAQAFETENDLVQVQDEGEENPDTAERGRRGHRGGCNLEEAAAAIGIDEAELREALDIDSMDFLNFATALHEARVKQAKMALKEAEEKRAIVRKWDRHYDGQVDPLMKQVNKLDNYLNTDMPKAIQFLTGAIKALADYAETAAPSLEDGAPAAPAPGDEEEAGSPEA